jgi:hypothetical protein
MKLLWLAAAAALAAASGADSARAASVREQQSFDVWRKQDNCAHAAFLKFPDYTPESNANRARATRECEIKNNVRPRPPVVVSPVKTIPDAAAD